MMSVQYDGCGSRLDEDGHCDECDDMTSFMDNPRFMSAYDPSRVLTLEQKQNIKRILNDQSRRWDDGTVGKKAE